MRSNSTITIERFTSNDWAAVPTDVVTVPITIGSRRKFHLMQEDSITLVFSLTAPIEFKVGDYINDAVFGLFIVRERQMPTYNKVTGGYDYNLRFDRAYWLWENHILMLSAGLSGADPITPEESDGTITLISPQLSQGQSTFPYKREESIWCLTNSLAYHVQQVLYNLLAAGLLYRNRAYNARILPSATKAKEIRYINYDATRICSALTEIANQFECEWWVTYETANNTTTGWINFGKCELGNTPKEFRLKDMEGLNVVAGNVETLQASRDLTNYANRIYVFGGTQNMSESYRKKLILHVDTTETIGSDTCFLDSNRKVDPYTMLQDDGTQVEQISFQLTGLYFANARVNPSTTPVAPPNDNEIVHDKGVTTPNHSIISYRTVAHKVGSSDLTFGFKKDTEIAYSSFNAGLRFNHNANVLANMRLELKLFLEEFDTYTEGAEPTRKIYLSDNPYVVETSFTELSSPSDVGYIVNFVQEGKVKLTGGKTYKLVLEGRAEFDVEVGGWIQVQGRDYIGVSDTASKCLITMPAGKSFAARVIWGNTTYPITFNPSGYIDGEDESYYFKFDNGTPSGFSPTQLVELLDYFAYAVPQSYYTEDADDPSSLIGLGERRLRLPTKNGGQADADGVIIKDGYAELNNVLEVQRDEMVVKNDNIYPKCYLKVTSVKTEERTEKIVYADGTEYEWPWTAYTMQVEMVTTAQNKAFPFRRTYVKEGEKLKASFLSDYNEQKAYREMGVNWASHDGYLLAGMTFEVAFRDTYSEYTLIRNEDYGAKLPSSVLMPKVGDTFILTGWDVKAMENLNLVSTAENQLASFAKTYLIAMQEDGWMFRCGMMTDMDEPLYAEGTKVKVFHEGLSGGYKESRVIGYELKLDIPENSPVYEVGETEAYSRIKALERSLTKSDYGYWGNIADIEIEGYDVTCNFDNVTSNAPSMVDAGGSLSVTLAATSGNKVQANSVVVTMGGNDITSSTYNHSSKTITIASVTGNVTITAIGRPYDAEVEYLQSNGQEWIVTGVNLRQKLSVKVTMIITKSISANSAILGAWKDGSSTVPKFQLYVNSSQKWPTISSSYTSYYSYSGITANTSVSLNTEYTPIVNNLRVQSSDMTIYLFARNHSSDKLLIDGLRIIACEILDDNNDKIRDYIPVRNNGVGYLYDKVSGELFGNASGSGAFSYGNDKT